MFPSSTSSLGVVTSGFCVVRGPPGKPVAPGVTEDKDNTDVAAQDLTPELFWKDEQKQFVVVIEPLRMINKSQRGFDYYFISKSESSCKEF